MFYINFLVLFKSKLPNWITELPESICTPNWPTASLLTLICVYFFCEVCDRFCKTESELTAHKQQHIPNEVQISVTCNFCEKNFLTQKDLMAHKKTNKMKHSQNVGVFGDNHCWFPHNTFETPDHNNLKCNFCEKTYTPSLSIGARFVSLPELFTCVFVNFKPFEKQFL